MHSYFLRNLCKSPLIAVLLVHGCTGKIVPKVADRKVSKAAETNADKEETSQVALDPLVLTLKPNAQQNLATAPLPA